MRNRISDLRTPRSDALRLYFMAKFIVPLLNYQNYHCRVITQYHTMSLKQNLYRVLFLSHTWFKDKKALKLINRNTCKLRFCEMKLFQVSRGVIKKCPFCNKLSFILQYMNRSFFQWGNNHVPLLLCIYCNMIQQQLQIVSICKPFNSHEQPRKKILLTIKIQKHCNIKQKSDENKENYQLGDS